MVPKNLKEGISFLSQQEIFLNFENFGTIAHLQPQKRPKITNLQVFEISLSGFLGPERVLEVLKDPKNQITQNLKNFKKLFWGQMHMK